MIKKLYQDICAFTNKKHFAEIFRGSSFALLSRIFATFFALISNIFIARFYSSEILGIYSLINSILAITAIVTLLGTNISSLRLIPEGLLRSGNYAYKIFLKITIITMVASCAFGIIFFLAHEYIGDVLFDKPEYIYLLMFVALVFPFRSFVDLSQSYFRALKKIKLFAVAQMLPSLITLILLVSLTYFFISDYLPIYAQLFGYFLSGSAGILISFVLFESQKNKLKSEENDAFIAHYGYKSILKISFPMMMTTAMLIVIGHSDVLILGFFLPERDVGYYSIAVRVSYLTNFILTAVNTMAAPKFSELYQQGRVNELFALANDSCKLIFWASFPLMLLILIFGKFILIFLFGHEFIQAYYPLVLLTAGQFINSAAGSVGHFMNMTGDEKTFRNVVTIALLLNVVLNFICIPGFGIVGAALASMVSISFWNIALLTYIYKKYKRSFIYLPWMSKWI